MPFAAYLFDLDGTLVDSVGDLATAVNQLRGENGLSPLSRDEVRVKVGDGASQLVRRSLPEGLYSGGQLQRFLALYAEHLADTTVLYPGMTDVLDALAGIPLAVVTNKPLHLTHALLDALQLRARFSAIVGGDSCPVKKPHPVPVQLALHQLGVAPQKAVMIGDHHVDLAAGAAAGTATCFCTWGLGEDGGLAADYRIATPGELLRLSR